MIYRDCYETDSNLRFVNCPRCGNEEYSEDAKYCRICGFSAFNVYAAARTASARSFDRTLPLK